MPIRIKTPERVFETDPDTWIGRSIYFDNLLSGDWSDKQEDGTYFVETDANVFSHVLRYLRTGVLPVFFDPIAGHDYSLYQALLAESRYFAIGRLERWLIERRYLDVIKIRYTATETRERGPYQRHATSDLDGPTFTVEDCSAGVVLLNNTEIVMTPITRRQNSFYCPAAKHGKSSEEYCRSCVDQARGKGLSGYGGWKAEDQLVWCIARKEVTFDHQLCAEAYLEDRSPSSAVDQGMRGTGDLGDVIAATRPLAQ